jgi:hypothetical protein
MTQNAETMNRYPVETCPSYHTPDKKRNRIPDNGGFQHRQNDENINYNNIGGRKTSNVNNTYIQPHNVINGEKFVFNNITNNHYHIGGGLGAGRMQSPKLDQLRPFEG